MANVVIKKTLKLNGEVCASPSKSYTQRMLIAAALSEGTSKISNPLDAEDTEAAIRAVTALGAKVMVDKGCWTVEGASPLVASMEPIDCGESGATLRFMIPVAALATGSSVLVFHGSFEKRPVQPLLESLKELGSEAYPKKLGNKNAVFVKGSGIMGGKTSLPGNISSQFVSGLLFACPLAKETTEIAITTPLESKDYVEMTIEVLAKHGIKIFLDNSSITIPPNQMYKSNNGIVPGDFSSSAFLLAAAAMTKSRVKMTSLDCKSIQGDKAILGILKQMGVNGEVCEDSVEIAGTGDLLKALNVNAMNIPDLVPALTVLACHAAGTSRISGVHRLRLKESDRLKSLSTELGKMGAEIIVDEGTLTVKGPCALHGAVIDPHNDHRIAMACAIAALLAESKTIIQNAECVRKSYPQFFNHLTRIGADMVDGKLDR